MSTDSGGSEIALRLAALELAIGMPRRALEILSARDTTDSTWLKTASRLRAEAEFSLARYEDAGRSFGAAFELAPESDRAILATRAGVAFELAGLTEAARGEYARAGSVAPRELKEWIVLRQAAVTSDTAIAFQLLSRATPVATPLIFRVRGGRYAHAGDTVNAISAFERGGYPVDAARLALARGDSADGRRLAYDALDAADTAMVRSGMNLVERSFPPQTAQDYLALAGASRRLRSLADAARFANAAVSAGDSSAKTLLYLGGLFSASRSRRRALSAYRHAASIDGDLAPDAEFWYGRTLLRLGRVDEGMRVLSRFVDRFPDHDAVPRAIYGMADRRRRERRYSESDSLNRLVAEGWPRHRYASSARMDLAAVALHRRDTATAVEWYRKEIAHDGRQRNVAQYRLGALREADGDTVSARAIWAALARHDSLGYYGTMARTAASLPALTIEPPPPRDRSESAEGFLTILDFLRDAYLEEELTLFTDSLLAGSSIAPAEVIELAEGLIERGLVSEGIRLGWLAARTHTLNHPRVMRAVFPWPYRDMIELTARENDLDPYLLAALIRQESAFTPDAISRAGAYGLMQLMPPTAREVARRLRVEWDEALLTVPDANLHLGSTHLAALLRNYDNRIVLALAAYNAGGTPVRRWLRSFGYESPVHFVERVPYVETRGYLRTVLRNLALYRALYPAESGGRTSDR